MMKVLVICMMLLLGSCSVMDMFSALKPSSGIAVDTEIVAGDKAINTEVSGSKKETYNTADSIQQTFNSVNKQYPGWIVVLLILGWTLPQPSVMGKFFWLHRPWKHKTKTKK